MRAVWACRLVVPIKRFISQRNAGARDTRRFRFTRPLITFGRLSGGSRAKPYRYLEIIISESRFRGVLASLVGIRRHDSEQEMPDGRRFLGTWVRLLAGVMLPSAIIFLQILLNDKELLGEFCNKPWNNRVNGSVILCCSCCLLVLAAQVAAPNLFRWRRWSYC